jgi:4-hydroxyphenylpyruvate dioxygenase-like putative hemolysin
VVGELRLTLIDDKGGTNETIVSFSGLYYSTLPAICQEFFFEILHRLRYNGFNQIVIPPS